MTPKIESLTEKQASLLPAYREKWLSIGMSCAPLDYEKAKAAVSRAYKTAGLEPPKTFFRFASPLAAALGATLLKSHGTVWDQVGAQVWDQVRDQVGAQVWDQVWDQVRDQVRAQVGDQVRDQVGDQVYGNHDAPWLGFYDFFGAEVGIDVSALAPLIELSRYCGWWAPYERAAILQDRPAHIRMDNDSRLHCEDGPAILYRDGFAVFAWRGVRVPREWIEEKESVTAKMALTYENVEMRRAACEIIGWDRILGELSATTVQKDEDPEIGELVEVDIPDIGRERFLRVRCGTGRVFALPVPPDMTTALEANAWTYGLDGNLLKTLEIRT